jgi:DCN1-like protein 1/2
MPPYSGVQKQLIAQFVAFTQAKDPVAAKVFASFLDG